MLIQQLNKVVFYASYYQTDLGVNFPFLPLSVSGKQNESILSELNIISILPDFLLSFYSIGSNFPICKSKGIRPRKLTLYLKDNVVIDLDFPMPFFNINFKPLYQQNILEIEIKGEKIDNFTLLNHKALGKI